MSTISDKHQKVTIVWRQDFAPDLWSIRVRPEEPLVFKPGQYATLGVEMDGQLIERAYSITSSPLEPEVEFFFELVPHGEMTPRLHRMEVGDSFYMRKQTKGLFTMDGKSGHKQHYQVCTVTGVAPFVSVARTLQREIAQGQKPDVRIVLLHGASRSWELAYDRELQALSNRDSWFYYVPTISRPWEDEGWTGEVGRAEDIVRKYLDTLGLEPSKTTAYLCGHPQMIENTKGILARRGFPPEALREEIYWVPKKEGKPEVV